MWTDSPRLKTPRKLLLRKAYPAAPPQLLDRLKPDIMPGSGVFRARIPEPHDEISAHDTGRNSKEHLKSRKSVTHGLFAAHDAHRAERPSVFANSDEVFVLIVVFHPSIALHFEADHILARHQNTRHREVDLEHRLDALWIVDLTRENRAARPEV